MSKLVEKRNEFEAKQSKLMKLYEVAGDDYDFMKCEGLAGKTNKERLDEVKKMNLELTDVRKELDDLVSVDNDRRNQKLFGKEKASSVPYPEAGRDREEPKSIGKLFVESKAYTDRKAGRPEVEVDCDVKTTFTSSAGWAPESLRSGKVIEYATRPIEIIDTIPGGTINQSSYKYMEETTFTDNASEVAENSSFGEAALALTERSQTVEKVGVDLPVTDEQLEDVAGLESYLNNRLTFMLRRRVGYQAMNGTGVTPYLQGMLSKSGIQSLVAGSDLFDSIAEAIMKIQTVGFATASVIYVNAANWWSNKLRLKRDNNGNYILGNPQDMVSPNIFGVRVVPNVSIAAGTILIADTLGYTQYFEKRGITFKITDSHASEFVSGVQRIRADLRGVMVIFRASALCKLTGC